MAEAEAEHAIEPDGVADDLSGEAVAPMGAGNGFISPVSSGHDPHASLSYSDNAADYGKGWRRQNWDSGPSMPSIGSFAGNAK